MLQISRVEAVIAIIRSPRVDKLLQALHEARAEERRWITLKFLGHVR
jgi:hypothetical protein